MIKQSLASKTKDVIEFAATGIGLVERSLPMPHKNLVNTSELGRAVRRRREEKGLSLRDVAGKGDQESDRVLGR